MSRAVLYFPIVRARRTDRIAIACSNDFVRGSALDAPDELCGLLPYCLDFVQARAIYVAGIDAGAASAAPFYYLHLRRNARSLVSVPIEHGRLGDGAQAEPVFVFSPGRCGSTLLSRILNAAGIASPSEPDFYTQMSSVLWSSPCNPLRAPYCRAMWNMSADLCAAVGNAPVIKLRAECCRAPGLFVRAPQAKTIMMMRSFEDWAPSTARVFAPNPGKAVRKYLRAVRCHAWLAANSRCHTLVYQGLIGDTAATAAGLAHFLEAPVRTEALRAAMAVNAQKDTPLEGRSQPGWQAKFDGIMRLWHSPRLVSARARLGVSALWD